MKLRILMMTAAVGLAITSAAMAATTTTPVPATATTTSTTTVITTTPNVKTVLDLTDGNSEFSTLAKAIKAAGLEQTLAGQGPITVFAPTNAAFAKLGPAKLNELLNPANKAELTQILTYHVVPQSLPNVPPSQLTSLTTAEGQSINVTHQATGYQVQNAHSLGMPMGASNGSIIAIDTVLTPEAQAKMATAAPSDPNAALPSVPGTMMVKTVAPATTTSVTTTTTAAPAAPPAMTK